MKNRAVFFYLVLLSFFLTDGKVLLAADPTTQTTTPSGFTPAQTQQAAQTSQNLIDSKNTIITIPSTAPLTPAQLLNQTAANLLLSELQSNSGELSNFNLIYKTVLTTSGAPTASDSSVLLNVTSPSSFNQVKFLSSLQKAADTYNTMKTGGYLWYYGNVFGSTSDYSPLVNAASDPSYNQTTFIKTVQLASNLYRYMQSNSVNLSNFNLIYKTSLPTTGYPSVTDRATLLNVAGTSNFNQTSFLAILQKAADLYKAIKSNTSYTWYYNNIFGGASDYSPLLLVVSDPAYTQANFLTSILKASGFYHFMQANIANLSNFNLIYKTSLLTTGYPNSTDRAEILSVVSDPAFNQTTFLTKLQKVTDLYNALLADSDKCSVFNTRYFTQLPTSGSPSANDRNVLFVITGASNFDLASFLNSLTTLPTQPPPPPPPTGELFSPTSFWNQPLSANQALNANSANYVNEFVANTQLAGPWINITQYSTPYYIVDSSATKAPVSIVQNGQTLTWTALYQVCQQGIPIPANVAASGGLDGEITIYDKSADKLYEFWQFKKVNGQWQASWGGIIDNASTSSGIMPTVKNTLGGDEQWGATATGLPTIGGTMLLKEVQAGVIPHELAVAIVRPATWTNYVWPAQRSDGWYTGPNAIPEGTRFRFPANITIDPNWSPIVKMMVIAIRDYGMIVRDQASSVVFTAEDPTQYGKGEDAYAPYFGGLQLWDVMKQFPWDKLQALA